MDSDDFESMKAKKVLMGLKKSVHTLRSRMSIEDYMLNAINMFRQWSIDRLNRKIFNESLDIPKIIWQNAYSFLYDEDSDPQITIIGRSKNMYALYDAKYKHLAAKDYLFNKIENLEKSNFDQIILQKKRL